MLNIIQNFLGYQKIFSIFPELYNYRDLAPFILRCSIGVIFFSAGWSQFYKRSGVKSLNMVVGSIKMVISVFLILGLYTQIFALIGSVISVLGILLDLKNNEKVESVAYNFLMLMISLSLLLTGPGAYAFDLPL